MLGCNGAEEHWTCVPAQGLVLKAKLEAGITTLKQEFLADMVLPGDVTVSEALLPNLQETLRTGRMPGVLPRGGAIPLPPAR